MAPRDIHELVQVLPNIDVSDVMEIPSVFECDDQTLPCDHTSKFRTATGWCNNLNNPGFGKGVRALNRLVRPHYGDGEWKDGMGEAGDGDIETESYGGRFRGR